MKTSVKIASVLSWINIVVWGFLTLCVLLLTLVSGNMPMLIVSFLMSAIVLHSFAAIKFNTSLTHPNTPLTERTTTGMRIMGYAALLTAFLMIAQSIAAIPHIPELLKASPVPQQFNEQFKGFDITGFYRRAFEFMILLGLLVVANVFINARLLKWYFQQIRQNQQKQED